MTFTITPGWWILPLAITIALFVWAAMTSDDDPGPYGAGAFLNGVLYLLAAFGSVVAWLIWSLLR